MNAVSARLVLVLFGVAFLIITWREYRRAQRDRAAEPRLQHHRKRAVVGYALGLCAMAVSMVSIKLGGTLVGLVGVVFFVVAVVCFGYGMISLVMIGWIKGGEPPVH
jgi:small-conductance mechanosensitive channel